MKAIILTQYGQPDVLQLKEVPKPIPKDNEVLVKVKATTVNFGDLLTRKLSTITRRDFFMPTPFLFLAKLFLGFRKPRKKILGSEFSGNIEAVGSKVTQFKPGDAVFGYLAMNFGAYAEYLCIPAKGMIALKPDNCSYEEAATFPYGATTALALLKLANIQKGQKVLINGASGGMGHFAVQLAKSLGAEVTGVCSTKRLELVKSLGANKVIDYTKEDFTTQGETYDLIFDVLGKCSFSRCKKSLKPNGRYLLGSFKMKQLIQMFWTSLFSDKKVICGLAPEKVENLITVKQLIEQGAIKTIIDKCFPLEQCADAHSYVEQGNKKGQIVILV